MMKIVKKICLVGIIALTAGLVQAQSLKFAHIDQNALIMAMPEVAGAQQSLQDYAKGLEEQLGALQKEYTDKLTQYQEQNESMTEIVRESKEEELSIMQQRVLNFRDNANQKLQQKEAELFQPIFDKALKAIEEVAKQQGVIYVFDVNTVLYKSPASIDILPMVKTKLGIAN